MAKQAHDGNFTSILDAAQKWITSCLIEDRSILGSTPLWTPSTIGRLKTAFIDHPDNGDDDFLTKILGQLGNDAPEVRHLAAEMLWAMYLFPSNIRPATKRRKIMAVWGDSADAPRDDHPLLSDVILGGIGSAGPGYNNHFWREVAFVITWCARIKEQPEEERRRILTDYDSLLRLIRETPEPGQRQFRHMLRFFCFPDHVERIASIRELRKIVVGMGVASKQTAATWSDDQLDTALADQRRKLELERPGQIIDFYAPGIVERWQDQAPAVSAIAARVAEPSATYARTTTTDYPLNQILYGPPGTGKTYRAMRMAIEICTGEPLDDGLNNKEVTQQFEKLRAAGRIALATFHQSTSYEDFVEGLRPDPRPDGTLGYTVKPGLFRVMCDRARAPEAGAENDIDDATIWKMSLGDRHDSNDANIYGQCLERGLLALGYGLGLDFTGCDSREAVLKQLQTKKPDLESSDYNFTSVHAFKNRMQVGDIVVVTNGNLLFRAIGRVTGDYQPPHAKMSKTGPESVDQWQTRAVTWLWKATDDGRPYTELSSKRFSQQTIYDLRYAEIDVPILRKLIAGTSAAPVKKHVMIIDEINRGNVARILGELITCIEPLRRLDQDEETRVQLTYSQLHFGVPANLYLIGTMNTADRSIAFLDSALRRRFRFMAVAPQPELLADIEIDGVEVDALVQTINDRLAVLLDEDRQLGHAYFLRVATAEDLRRVLVDQIIPLLREQFHGDDQRLCLALGCPYDPESGAQTNAHPMLKADPINLGSQESPRLRIRLNPLFLKASGPDLTAFLAAIAGPA